MPCSLIAEGWLTQSARGVGLGVRKGGEYLYPHVTCFVSQAFMGSGGKVGIWKVWGGGSLGEVRGAWHLQGHTWGGCHATHVSIRACGSLCPCVSEVSLLSSGVWGQEVEQTPCVKACPPTRSVALGSTIGPVHGGAGESGCRGWLGALRHPGGRAASHTDLLDGCFQAPLCSGQGT